MKLWLWAVGGLAMFALGAFLWWTAFVSWPLGVVLILVGGVGWVSRKRKERVA